MKSVLIISVLLVAPSASLAGPVPAPEPGPVPRQDQAVGQVVVPWAQGAPGGFIYCAGCSPINPQQLVIPSDVPISKALPLISASGVLPPGQVPVQKQSLNGEEPGKVANVWEDAAVPEQQMALHDDGRYRFSYNTAHSSRQEERTLDGSVSGSYSYTDPQGKVVQIDYTAGPKGYNAYGENVPLTPVFQLPQPVLDTPEVQEAREKFMQAYANELARHQQVSDNAHGESTVVPVAVNEQSSDGEYHGENDGVDTTVEPSSNDGQYDPSQNQGGQYDPSQDQAHQYDPSQEQAGQYDPSQDQAAQYDPSQNGHNEALADENNNNNEGSQVVIGKSEPGHQEVADDQAESIVIASDDAQSVNPEPVNLPSPSYQITIPFGVGENAGVSVQNLQQGQRSGEAQAVPVPVMPMQGGGNANAQPQSNLQPYFYYVSVGGTPHYVTAPSVPGYNSPYPTSLKASLLGAIPLAPVHDAQVSTQSSNNDASLSVGVNRPVYLDLGNSVQDGSYQNMQTIQNTQQMPGMATNFNYNFPAGSHGQLIPIGLTPISNGASIGYIPGLVLNNGGIVAAAPVVPQQQNQGSQMGGAQQMPGSFMYPSIMPQMHQQPQQPQQQMPMEQQQVNSPVPAQDESVIVLANKK